MIKADCLTRKFGDLTAVDRVEFEVPQGSVTGFLGPNGAGKTTTMRMLCGVLTPTSGRAWIDGSDVTSGPELFRNRVGYLPESAPVYPEMRVQEYLRFRAGLYRVRSVRAAIDRALEQCGLVDVARRIIGHLSKGFRQRVALAAALLHEPRVLVLDEPTAGLDPTQVDSIRGLIADLAQDRAILLSTHILSEVEAVCDSIVMIAGGRVLARGTLEAVCGGDALVCHVETDLADAVGLLAGVAGVSHVQATSGGGGWNQYQVTASAEQDPRAGLAAAIAEAGGQLREIHARRRSLEDVFRTLVSAPAEEKRT
ncbi:MAG: ABC transporter ATP-binding protein [Phycisphaerales bacterium]|nr:ABC transporter ATP-binding protein [Phycisphaerales bacterium]